VCFVLTTCGLVPSTSERRMSWCSTLALLCSKLPQYRCSDLERRSRSGSGLNSIEVPRCSKSALRSKLRQLWCSKLAQHDT
jgi:hypothetical protein